MNLFIFLCIEIFLFVLVKTDQYCTSSSFDKIFLSRKKRFLVYPDGSSFAVKRSFSKAILDNIPRGVVLNCDCGIYYPLPGSKDPWNPAKLLYRLDLARTGGLSATKKPKLKPKVDVNVNSMNDNIGVANVDNINPQLYFPSKYHWNGNRKSSWHGNEYYTGPTLPKWNQIEKNMPKRKHYNLLPHRGTNISRAEPHHSTILTQQNLFPSTRNLSVMSFKNHKKAVRLEKVHWLHHREYRERREVYAHSERLGNIFDINMKACMMRAICEMNEDLLPEGQSFILDIARILFDFPTDHDFNDDYANIAREKNVNCAKRFLFSCPYSPIEFLTHSVRLNGIKDVNIINNSIVYV